ncbi:Peptidase S8/S53 domain-containing protein [Cinnamomum micranthum f. kanehirae]|uniref:Peptidase S8/S53 domain-containing protein n=1 Tax=Cinnamomum micranthum f. kanehirae TaxID=337451 RepID=A0A443PV24_9MAGN|nr:Peptidase S8/S53 domain-containing protein [Cinnamomum micranthum f. kanehirae]
MTTAYVHENVGTRIIDAATGNASTVWDVGSGHVDSEKAVDPGLVYDLTVDDYLRFLFDSNYTEDNIRSISHRVVSCRGNGTRPWDLNYPSISVVFDESTVRWKEIEVRRSVMNVGDGAAVYEAKVKSPDGTQVMVDPTRLEFGGKVFTQIWEEEKNKKGKRKR